MISTATIDEQVDTRTYVIPIPNLLWVLQHTRMLQDACGLCAVFEKGAAIFLDCQRGAEAVLHHGDGREAYQTVKAEPWNMENLLPFEEDVLVVFTRFFICKVRARLDGFSDCPAGMPHEGVQAVLQRIVIPGYGARFEHVTCDRHKAVGHAGKIDFQSMFPVVDVVDGLVVGKIRGEPEESAETGTARGFFKIDVRKE